MDSTFAFKGKDFVILAADTVNVYSVMKMKVSLPLISESRRQNLAARRQKADIDWRIALGHPQLRRLHPEEP